ncbi:MAG: hypothetical protein FWC95_04405 [Defluviitaleaceae bacterium]|nr:hypothetical protein [Defluviitaleaceae bacterium]
MNKFGKNHEERIKTMAKLAVYDKYHASQDKKKAEFFQRDYVYRRNVVSRFLTLVGSLIAAVLYMTHRVVVGGLDILDIGAMTVDLVGIVIFIIIMQLLYTLLGSLLYSDEYNKAGERIQEYIKNMKKLGEIDRE